VIGSNSRVILRNKRMSDARDDYNWQKDPELSQLDATVPLDYSFDEYLADYASEVQYPYYSRRPFAIDTVDGKHIGNCVYYNVDDKKSEAELGIMIGDRDYWGQGYGTETMTALIDHVFRRTRLDRLYLKTLTTNLRAQKCFNRCGLEACGYLEQDSYSFLLMEIHRQQWQAASP